MNPVTLFFSHAGNINRRTYAAAMAGLFWTVPAVAAIFPPAALLLIPMLYAMACLTVKRLHDIGLSGKWALLPLAAIFVYIAVLLVSGLIAFGAGVQDAGSHAEDWATAVGAWLGFGTFLSWVALVFMPGNMHTRRKFGRPPPPLVQPPVPDLAAVKNTMRQTILETASIAGKAGGAALAATTTLTQINYLKLFFLASGRIGRGAYVAAFTSLLLAGVLMIVWLGSLPGLGWIAIILLFYCITCLASKRLHDFGMGGWVAAVPFIVFYALGVFEFGLYLIEFGFFGTEVRNHPLTPMLDQSTDDTAGHLLLASFAAYAAIGLVPGERGPNRHGDPPGTPEPGELADAVAA